MKTLTLKNRYLVQLGYFEGKGEFPRQALFIVASKLKMSWVIPIDTAHLFVTSGGAPTRHLLRTASYFGVNSGLSVSEIKHLISTIIDAIPDLFSFPPYKSK